MDYLLLISFGIANVLAYLISSDELIKMIEEGPSSHLSTLRFLFLQEFLFYFVWFREQVCIIACPYGRLQGSFR
jgi:polyferredoxin